MIAGLITIIGAIPQMLELISNLVEWFGPDFDKAIREQNENYKAMKTAMESGNEEARKEAERRIATRWNRLPR